MAIKIGFIITCFNRGEYKPYLEQIFQSYSKIEPVVVWAYNGPPDTKSWDIRLINRGHQHGEYDLIMAGYDYMREKHPEVTKIVKLSIDSWLLHEDVILDIFDNMIHGSYCYGGNYWYEGCNFLSTDIFFADISRVNLFEMGKKIKYGSAMEIWMAETLYVLNEKPFIIPLRHPVHDINRSECAALYWTMQHDLQKNIDAVRRFEQISGKTILPLT